MLTSRRLFVASCAVLVLTGLAGGCAWPPTITSVQPRLILVSIDGFRWDFRDRGATPNLDRLAREGASAERLVPVFPTKTFPNHFTIVTGLYPENHGLVANNMYDPEFDAIYRLSERDEVADGRWYNAVPIWLTAEARGLRTAPVFWPGSEAEIDGLRPTHWEPFDGRRSDEQRVDALLTLLDVPASRRPAFLTLYFDTIDDAAHTFGPDASPALREAIEHIDSMIGRLLNGLENRGLGDTTDLVVVSDHGMSRNSRDRVILIDDFLDLEIANPIAWDPVLALWPPADRITEVFRKLDGAHPHLRAYRRENVPPRLRYSRHRRIPPIVAIADDGWAVTTRERFNACPTCFTGGNHGFDPAADSMGGLFIAAGPSFATGARLDRLESIHIYPLMCAVLGLPPLPNDGDPAVVEPLLAPRQQ